MIGTLLKLNCKLLTELKVHLDGIIGFTAAASVEQSSFQNHSAKLSLNPYFPIANCQNIILRDEVGVFSFLIECVFQGESDLQSQVGPQAEADR